MYKFFNDRNVPTPKTLVLKNKEEAEAARVENKVPYPCILKDPYGFSSVAPTPATHAILTLLKAGECIRHSI